jgi:hypothetical protein
MFTNNVFYFFFLFLFFFFFYCVVDSSMATSRDSLGKSNKRTVQKAFICTCCPLCVFVFPFLFWVCFMKKLEQVA